MLDNLIIKITNLLGISFVNSAWLALALILLIIELLIPGFFLICIGLASFVVFILGYFLPLSTSVKIMLFALLSLIITFLGKNIYKSKVFDKNNTHLNQKKNAMIGNILILEEPIINGRGRIHIKDSMWTIEGKEDDSGTQVRVVAIEGNILKVEKIIS